MGAVQEKVWFVYLTDHHEGPLTLEEVEKRLAGGDINKDSLAWKDGMPDWVAISSIPELAALLNAIDQTKNQKDPNSYQTLQFTDSVATTATTAAPASEPAPEAEAGLRDPLGAAPLSPVGVAASAEESADESLVQHTRQGTGSLAERLAAKQKAELAKEKGGDPAPVAAARKHAPSGDGDGHGLNFDLGDPGQASSLDLEKMGSSKLIPRPEAAEPTKASQTTVGSVPSLVTGARARPDATKSTTKPAIMAAPAAALAAAEEEDAAETGELDETEQVWSVQSQGQVTGLYTYAQIRELVANGQLGSDYLLWRAGWSEFRPDPYAGSPGSAAPAVGQALVKPRLNPMPAAPPGSGAGDDPEDFAEAIAHKDQTKKFGFLDRMRPLLGIWQRFVTLFKRYRANVGKTETKATAALVKQMQGTGGIVVPKGGGERTAVSARNLIVILGVGGVLALGLGAWSLGLVDMLFASLPEIADVTPEDYARLKTAAKASKSDGIAFATARSKDDAFNPVVYIATNAPEGTKFSLELKGVPGTLVNAVTLELRAEGSVDATRLVKLGPLSQAGDGKPLPMGDYKLKVATENAEAFEEAIVIGNKGPAYERRMKSYQEQLQKWYDYEIMGLRQLIQTLVGIERAIGEKYGQVRAARSPNVGVIWDAFATESQQMLAQIQPRLKELAAVDATKPDGRKEIFFPHFIQSAQKYSESLGRILGAYHLAVKGEATPVPQPADLAIAAEMRAGLEHFLTPAVEDKPIQVLVKNLTQGLTWAWPKGATSPTTSAPVTVPLPSPAPAATLPVPAPAPAAPVTPAASIAPIAPVAPVAAPVPVPAPVVAPSAAPAAMQAPQPFLQPLPQPTPAQPVPAPAALAPAPAPVGAPDAAPASAAPTTAPAGLSPEELKALESIKVE